MLQDSRSPHLRALDSGVSNDDDTSVRTPSASTTCPVRTCPASTSERYRSATIAHRRHAKGLPLNIYTGSGSHLHADLTSWCAPRATTLHVLSPAGHMSPHYFPHVIDAHSHILSSLPCQTLTICRALLLSYSTSQHASPCTRYRRTCACFLRRPVNRRKTLASSPRSSLLTLHDPRSPHSPWDFAGHGVSKPSASPQANDSIPVCRRHQTGRVVTHVPNAATSPYCKPSHTWPYTSSLSSSCTRTDGQL